MCYDQKAGLPPRKSALFKKHNSSFQQSQHTAQTWGAKIPEDKPPGRQIFVYPRLLFVGPQYETYFMSLFRPLEIFSLL